MKTIMMKQIRKLYRRTRTIANNGAGWRSLREMMERTPRTEFRGELTGKAKALQARGAA